MQRRLGLSTAAIIGYVLLFFLLYPEFRESSAALVILPVAVIAGLGGLWPGLIAGILSFPLNTLLLNIAETRAAPWTAVIDTGGGPGTLAIVLIGLLVGAMCDQRKRIIRELSLREQVEHALSESEQRFRELAEHIEQVFWLEDLEGSQIFYVSPAYETILGRTRQSLYEQPRSWFDGIHPEDMERLAAARARKVSGPYSIEYRIIRPDGSVRWIWSRAFPIRDKTGEVYRIAGIAEDITERKAAEETLKQSEERFKLMAWATKDAVWDWDIQAGQTWWGEGLQKIFHYSPEMTRTNSEWWFEHIHPEDRPRVRRTIDQALEGGMEFWSKEYRFQRKDGTYADIMDRGYILRDDTGRPYRMIGAMLDISERKQMESTLIEANERMRGFLNDLQDRNREVALLNEMSHLLQACQTEQEAYGVIADLARQMFPRTAGALYLRNATRSLVSAAATWGELPLAEESFSPAECWAWRLGQTLPLRDEQTRPPCLHHSDPPPGISHCLPMQVDGQIHGVLHVQSRQKENWDDARLQLAYTVVEQATMVLSNLRLHEALREQSIRDPLTGLHNRRYMEEVLRQQLSRVTRHLRPLSIIMLDIDHFKVFNDTHGHGAGDMLLRELGRLLQSHIRGEDVACRYGGEEFTLILPDASLEVAGERAEYLREEAKRLRVQDNGKYYGGVTLSLGVAVYPQHGRSMDAILEAADAALYRAKQEGRDRVRAAG